MSRKKDGTLNHFCVRPSKFTEVVIIASLERKLLRQ